MKVQLGQWIDGSPLWECRRGHFLFERLSHVYPPPQSLYFVGHESAFLENAIAVVGGRVASARGIATSFKLSQSIAENGWAVVSGLARGIDASSHWGVLKGKGPTVAVFGCGLDKVYPPEHEKLAREIVSRQGALLSEFPLGTPPIPSNFPRRNRLIAGLVRGILVVEARVRSGSLITARLGLELGKDIFVTPGPCGDANYEGSHLLIQEGAKLITQDSHIFEEYGIYTAAKQKDSKGSTEIGKLKEMFKKAGGSLLLADIASVSIPEAEKRLLGLCELIEKGEVIEVFPQHFILVSCQSEKSSEQYSCSLQLS